MLVDSRMYNGFPSNDVLSTGAVRNSIMAAKDGDSLHLVREVTDLWFHCMVMLAHQGLSAQDVLNELARREGISGLEEKAGRKAG